MKANHNHIPVLTCKQLVVYPHTKVLNDSIYEANKIIHKENEAMIPIIAKQYDRFIADSLEISESELYHFIVDYYATGSDTTLKSMILYAMNIEVNADFDLAKLILTASDFTNYNSTKTVIYAYYVKVKVN